MRVSVYPSTVVLIAVGRRSFSIYLSPACAIATTLPSWKLIDADDPGVSPAHVYTSAVDETLPTDADPEAADVPSKPKILLTSSRDMPSFT